MTFDEMKARIARHIDYDFICDTPYKACDYILLYGLIFRDYLEDYEFWGHCDPDVIWGDMSKFITPEIMDKYGRIYRLGHLQMFRNTEKVRTFALQKLPDWGLTCRDIFTAPEHMAFEEYVMTEKLFDEFVGEGLDLAGELEHFLAVVAGMDLLQEFFDAVAVLAVNTLIGLFA